ncbi:hypothetical protein [Roseibium salinum]|uniref:Uncharacterized protein n=1 Tax=Roseibium salinum TaxID=1604349 RepID=A0ABT3QWL4_9HYPH|nr:hypothetical protein [Roseibium sp. DSM 29163]MCX2721306.1 hypothetical protein [Roseibium sp. DSM 29163]MDN3722175.1 hypothetical protein [Roseibium salinum]
MNAKFFVPALVALPVVLAPELAHAYVGPGAGLSLLGALWALVAAVGLALFFVVAWPIRKLLRRKRVAAVERQATEQSAQTLSGDSNS